MGVKRSKQKINPPPHRVLYFRFDLFRNVTVGGGWGCSWCTPGSTEYVFPFRLENVCDKNVTNSAEDGTLAFIYFGGGGVLQPRIIHAMFPLVCLFIIRQMLQE